MYDRIKPKEEAIYHGNLINLGEILKQLLLMLLGSVTVTQAKGKPNVLFRASLSSLRLYNSSVLIRRAFCFVRNICVEIFIAELRPNQNHLLLR